MCFFLWRGLTTDELFLFDMIDYSLYVTGELITDLSLI